MGGPAWRLPLDAETRLNDVQGLSRREALKRRDDGATVSLLVVAGTRHNRHVLRIARADLIGTFPTSSAKALAALARGEPPDTTAIVVL